MLHSQRRCRSGAGIRCAAGLVSLLIPIGLAAQQAAPAPTDPPPHRVRVELETSHLGYTYVGEGGIRYFVTQLRLTNHSDQPVTVAMANIQLTADGHTLAADVQHPQLTGYDFRVGGRSFRFRDLPQTESLTLAAGEDGTAWVVFTDLVRTQGVPQLDLRVSVEGDVRQIDISEHYKQLLQIEHKRIGPRDCLALLTINGWLNSINVGTLVETIDQLGAVGLSRIVIGFGDDARNLDEPLASWLHQTAEGVQTSRTYAMFPAVTVPIPELHVAAVPGRGHDVAAAHVHGSVASAVEAALESAYQGLSPDQIAAQIEQGDRLAQAAALVNGGADLSALYLPLLLERAKSNDRLLRRGALIALSGSGSRKAVQTLARQARSQDARVAALALECLAASRFAGAHQQLQQLLAEPQAESLAVDEADVVRILARYPRPHWSEYLARLVTDRRQNTSALVQREVVLALGRIGHPQLTEILGTALRSPDKELQQAAFGLLLNRPDDASEQLALSYALQQIAQAPPTPAMLQLFNRVRDPRTTPGLLPYLDDEQLNKSALIDTLARIGPATIDDELADRYDAFDPGEQAKVLASLLHLRSPRLLPLAREGLHSPQHQVFDASVQALALQTDVEAVEALAARLADETEIERIKLLAKALVEIGLPEAGRALDAARRSSSGDKRRAIASHYRALQLKSPGGKSLEIAERHVQENKLQEALEYYARALRLDPDLGPAYSGRGHAHLKLERYKQAEADFRRGIELDEDDGLAVAGLGITLAISGRVDEAVRIVEDAAPRFEDDLLFAYNSACVYGRAIEQLAQQPQTGQSEQQIGDFQKAALTRLKASIELGFLDLDWMREDPDLASLRELEAFQKLASGRQDGKEQPQPRTPRRPPVPGEQ